MSINLMSAIFRTEFRDLQDNEGNTTKASTAKFVCIALADHANDEGEGAYPSINKIAYKTNLSRTAVINALDALKHNGILTAHGTSKWDTVNYTVKSECFSQDSQPALLVNPVDSPQYPQLTPPVNPVDPNHPLTIHKTSIEKSTIKGIEAALFSGRPVTSDDLPIMENALKEFESALSLPANWNWYPAKSGDEKAWRELREFVLDKWRADNGAFRKYATWRATPYVKGALSNLAIQRKPYEFITSWSDYLASDSTINSKTAPAYQPLPEDNNVYVPNPNRRTS